MPAPHRLVMRTGPTPGKTFSLSKNEVYIGRDITNEIVINDAEVSRKHARLTLQTGGYVLEDLGSTNGTFVEGQRLTGSIRLAPGMVVMLAENVSLVYEGPERDAEAPAMAPTEGEQDIREPAAVPPAMGEPTPGPMYADAVPEPPGQPDEERPRDQSQLWMLAGCGCGLLLLSGAIVAILYYIDINNLWCTLPILSDLLPCS